MEQLIYEAGGAVSDRTPGWSFVESGAKGGMVFNPAEGYYPDKGGRLDGPVLPAEPNCFYRMTFTARSLMRSSWGVNWYDGNGNRRIADDYGAFAAIGWQRVSRLLYAEGPARSVQPFFQSVRGIEVKDLKIERIDDAAALALSDELYSGLPSVDSIPEVKSGYEHLTGTLDAMRSGRRWKVVMLGDSIVNDTYNSCYPALLKARFPGLNWDLVCSVRGSTGCWYYRDPEQFQGYVADYSPDLLMIGGISQRCNLDAIREVVAMAQKRFNCEILLSSGPLAADWRAPNPGDPFAALPSDASWLPDDGFYEQLGPYAKSAGIAFLDLYTMWNRYLALSGVPRWALHRDAVHGSELGKQIVGRLLARSFR